MKIQILERADAALFQELRLRGLIECPSAFASSYAEECGLPLEEIGERLSPMPGRAVLGAFEETRLVGILGLMRERHAKLAHKAFLWGMYVIPESRNQGIGRELVREALNHARKMSGIRQVFLGVNAINLPAFNLYKSLGFEEFGREPSFMLLDGVLYDEIHMVCILRET